MKKGTRNGCNRFRCKQCSHWFTVDHRKKDDLLWIPHIDGIPFRKLGDEHGMSGKQACVRVFTELASLPDNTELTRTYCEYSSGMLIIDGKYIKVRGYKQKIPFIYGIDYETHDIVFGILVPAEDEAAFLQCFRILKSIHYPLKIVVADDRSSLPLALKKVFPAVPVQLCHNHYLEHIRQALHLRTDPTQQHFFHSLKKHVFDDYKNDTTLDKGLHHVLTERCDHNLLRQSIVMDIHRRRKQLFAYTTIANCPNNTNLIELFNSHFNARLRSLKGFKTTAHAKLWLNGLLLRRRTKPFTDCGSKFKHLNGKCSLEMSIKKQAPWPEILGIKAPER